MSVLAPARAAALTALMEAGEQDRYVRDVLDGSARVAALDARDAGFARRLALGVTAARGCLDELLDRCLDRPRRVSPRVRMALRISTFELLYLGTAPNIAVSQGVELVRSVAKGAAGLANAVLRRVAAEAGGYLAAADLDSAAGVGRTVRAARGAGLPSWLVSDLAKSLEGRAAGPDALAGLLACELEPAPSAAHVNACRAGEDLPAIGDGGAGAGIPGCIEAADVAALAASGALDRADAVVSDRNAQLVATAATGPGSCLEIGAGRGTKTFVMGCQALRAGYERVHVAVDLSVGKLAANAARLERAGMRAVRFAAGDARELDGVLAAWDAEHGRRGLFDIVFLDAPCSGTGTMRRHPEIPWRLAPQDVHETLPALQLALLQQAAGRVGLGGELLYATCSVLASENECVVDAFLASDAGKGFAVAPVRSAGVFSQPGFEGAGALAARHQTERGFFQTTPRPAGYDGHFCARLLRMG